MTDSATKTPFEARVFHPPGVIRLITPEEERAMYGSARSAAPAGRRHQEGSRQSMRRAIERAARALRHIARVWVEAQIHRAGI
jgi:hypothetical protein